MLINNQSKSKQITSKAENIRKGISKEIIPNKECLTSRRRFTDNSKSKDQKRVHQIKSGAQSKVKKITTKNAINEYFPHENRESKNRKQNAQSSKQRLIDKEQARTLNKNKKRKILIGSSDDEDNEIKKLAIPKTEVAINFEGKHVKIKRKDSINKNFTSYSNFEYALTERQVTTFQNKKSKKEKSKQKSSKGDYSKSKSKIFGKSKKGRRQWRSQEHVEKDHKSKWSGLAYEMNKDCLKIDEETQISPKREKDYERNQNFDFQQIHQLIKEDIEISKQIMITKQMMQNRKKCIKMMSEICGALKLRRETFYLSISIFDRVICQKLHSFNNNLLALVSLTLALKLQQSKLSLQFIHILGLANQYSNQQSFQTSSSHYSSTSMETQKQNKKIKNNLNFCDEIGKTSTKEMYKILKKYQSFPVHKSQFIKMEQRVTVYLKFRLWRIQAIYWADLLTCLWDQLIMQQQNKEQNMQLLFRFPRNLKYLSYLYQILQLVYIRENEYRPSIHMVLSTMFLLLRIARQTHEDGFQFYRKSLISSANILFVDSQGINQLFWGFLEKLHVQMVDIVGCCQYISKHLQPQLFIQINNSNKDEKDDKLSRHVFNQHLYRP